MPTLALVTIFPPGWVLQHCLGLPFWHYQLVLSWYLHQPESQRLGLSDGRTSGPKYWTPGLPGSDKNWGANKRQIEVPIKEKIGARRKVFGAMRTGTAVMNYGARYFDLLCHILICFSVIHLFGVRRKLWGPLSGAEMHFVASLQN